MPIASKRAGRALVAGVAALSASALFAVGAEAASASVKSACANDYFAYCSGHDPDGPGVRQCFRANGSRLSKSCINALAAAGQIPQKLLAKRSQAKR